MYNKKVVISILVLVVVHAVGLYGLTVSENPAWFRALTPYNLLLTMAVLFLFHQGWNKAFGVFAGISLLTGFLVEVVGVHTGLLFGHYQYGQALGVKLWEVPLLIAANWLLLVYVAGVLVQPLTVPWWGKALLAAGLMVLLDLLMEPVAGGLDLWIWKDNHIPASNYWAWLGVALLLQLYFQKAPFSKDNPLAPAIYGLQALFFIGLNLWL